MKDVTLSNIIFPTDLTDSPEKIALYLNLTRLDDSAPLVSPVKILSHRQCEIPAHSTINFSSYFNAFPVGYWLRYTKLEYVTLLLVFDAPADVNIFRSDSSGHKIKMHQMPGTSRVRFSIPIEHMFSAGWIWFEIVTRSEPVRLLEGAWRVNLPHSFVHKTAAIAITTMNKPLELGKQLQNFHWRIDDLAFVDRIYVVDQGTVKVTDQPYLNELSNKLKNKLQIIQQPNLGGSGGFSRGMLEFYKHTRADFVLLLDDDTFLETDCINRAIMFATLAKQPTIVGGHMLSMNEPSVLNNFAEVINPKTTWWGPAQGTETNWDFARQALPDTPWLHRVYTVDYNGWWMCLIPRQVITEIGLSMPFFIKWDDAEYSLRAKAHGFEVVSLPGVALWHLTWEDKDDARNWQAFYHYRNRLVVGLIYNNFSGPGSLIRWLFSHDVFANFSMRYSVAWLHLQAIKNVMAGPSAVLGDLTTRMQSIAQVRSKYVDAQEFPVLELESRYGELPEDDVWAMSRLDKIGCGAKAIFKQLLPVAKSVESKPQKIISTRPIRWIKVVTYDSVVVLSGDGQRATVVTRNPRMFFKILGLQLKTYVKLKSVWKKLQNAFRSQTLEMSSVRTWEGYFRGEENQ